ncbi:MAG: PLP-dependent aspartate aminotransferase family protein [Planctomycetaceae bacterium]|jgi:cystathionine beta-lyase|nr:PLP-dependent aspartate aminotransferase family protein [Planctomycetaceae bacterium]
MKFSTLAVRAGQNPNPYNGAVTVPVSLCSTYAYESFGNMRDNFEYARTDNPSRRALETTLAMLEGAKHAVSFASGQAASTSVLNLLESGDEVVTTSDIYGGTYRLFHDIFKKYGIRFITAESNSAESLVAKFSERTAIVWAETPSNPLLALLDIAELAERIKNFRNQKRNKPSLVIDNTFPSPALQNPLALGADIVTHSCTKYIGGHSDVIGGVVILNDDELWEKIKFYQNAAGAVPSPMDCFLLQRGIKTLPLRMKKHGENANAVANFLRGHKNVEHVFFPGFDDFPGHEIVAKQMRGLPGMVSFRIRGGIQEVSRFFRKLQIVILAESLGGTESLICHPATMTHASFPESEQKRAGITPNLIRVSLGIEDTDDLIDDFRNALDSLDDNL